MHKIIQMHVNVHFKHQNGGGGDVISVTVTVAWVLVSDMLLWVFQKLLIFQDFHSQQSLEFTPNGVKKKKNNHTGLWTEMPCFERDQRRIASCVKGNGNHSLQLWWIEKHLMIRRTSEPDGLQQQQMFNIRFHSCQPSTSISNYRPRRNSTIDLYSIILIFYNALHHLIGEFHK